MIVSILQLMGFPMGKPVHSRADEAPASKSTVAAGPKGTIEPAQATAARRQEVKAKPGKDTKTKPKAGKSKPASKPSKPVKAESKKSVKPVPKPVVKASVKSTPKTTVKPTAKPVAKPASKPVVKTVSKSVVKPIPKPAANTAPKPVTDPAAKKVAVPKAAVKPVVPPKAAPVNKTKVAPVNVSKHAAKPATPAKVPVSMPPIATKPVPVPQAPAPGTVQQKTGRPSSRLAQLTVPSMAQSVASTAAKASYSQAVVSPVIVPALPSSIKKDPKLANNWKSKPATELTDAELMAMPDSEYMNDVQMAAFRNKLAILKRGILNSAGETTEHLREDTSVVPDPADRATIEEEHALELRTRDRERKLLKKIEQSITRIDAGDYGYCDETGEPIGVGRLLARPTATLSLEAQQRRELKQKMFGD
jgi:DnaK suppressor protein